MKRVLGNGVGVVREGLPLRSDATYGNEQAKREKLVFWLISSLSELTPEQMKEFLCRASEQGCSPPL